LTYIIISGNKFAISYEYEKEKEMKRIIFKSWLAMLLLCMTIGSSYGLEIQKIEINQALGVQKDNHLYFVAGKDTVVRAFLSEEATITVDQTWAKVSKDGTQVIQLAPKSYDKPVKIVDFLCPTLQDCGNWAAGTYTFEVSVNSVVKKEPADGNTTTSYVFKERKEVRVLALAVKANYNGTIVSVADEKWKTMWRFTASVYPVAASKLKWEIRNEFDASADKYNQENEKGQQELWQALTNLMPSTCSANPKSEGCYDLIVGFIQARPKGYPNGTTQGYTYGKPTNIVVASDGDAPATVAHEIAHVYGVGDTYKGGSIRCSVNPAPNGMSGKDWDTQADTSCTAGRKPYPAPDELGAALITADQNPYEVGGRGLLGDMADYMGSCGSNPKIYWTTQDAYDWLFTQFDPAKARRFKRDPQRMIDFLGYIKKDDTVQVEPWKSFTDSSTVACTGTGTYTLVAVNNSGTVLASQALDVRFWTLNNPPEPIDPAPFKGAMCFPDGTVKFQIKKGDTVLKEVPVSANAPTISLITTPANPTGKFTIQWTAGDVDNDSLTYKVEYTPDASIASKWMVLEDGLDVMQWEEDFSLLPGGTNAKIRVTVTDGVLSAFVESSAFTVPVKSPEVFLDLPEWGDSYEDGDQIELEGETYDLQDERLPDNKLEWSSDLGNKSGSKIIGYGSRLIVSNLVTGEHTITLKATNSAGKSTISNPIKIYVGNISNQYSDSPATTDITLTNAYKNLNTTVKILKSAITKNTFASYEALKQPSVTSNAGLPANYQHIGRYFSLGAETEDSPDTWNAVNALGTVTLNIANLQLNNIDPKTLKLYRWDDAQKKWTDATSGCGTVTSGATTLSAQICRFGEFSVIGNALPPVVNPEPVYYYTPPPTPSAPTMGVSISGVSVSLSWSPVATAKGYKLLYRLDLSGLFTSTDIGNVTSVSYTLSEGIEFDVAIKGYNENGDGDASEIRHIRIPRTTLNVGTVGDDFKVKLSCAEYKGNQYELTLVPNSGGDPAWDIDIASFKQIYGKGADCLAVGDDLSLKLEAEYKGSKYSFTMKRFGVSSWKIDPDSVKKK
jgi:hypothetical protein